MASSKTKFFLKEWRTQRGWSQTELAQKMGTVKSEVSRLERGSRQMTMSWMQRAATAFGQTAESLMSMPQAGFSQLTRVEPEPEKKWTSERIGDIELGVREENHIIFPVLGDEWAGVFEPGDLLIADKRRKSALTGGLFAISIGEEIVVRRATVGEKGDVSLSAKDVRPTKLSDAVNIAGRVVARIVRV